MRRRLSFFGGALVRGVPLVKAVLSVGSLVAGLSVLAALAFLERLSVAAAALIGLAIILAVLGEGAYRIWNDADEDLAELNNAARDRKARETIRENLARRLILGSMAVMPGGRFGGRFLYESDEAYELAKEEARAVVKEWSLTTYKYLREKVGWDEAALFESDHVLPERYEGPSSYLYTEEDIQRFIARRCLRLEQILVRMRENESR